MLDALRYVKMLARIELPSAMMRDARRRRRRFTSFEMIFRHAGRV